MEDPYPSSLFLDQHNPMMSHNSTLTELLDFDQKSSSSFMELLNMQDFGGGPTLIDDHQLLLHQESSSPEALNGPATPNSSTISSESTHDEQTKEVCGVVEEEEEEEEDENHKTKKLLKPKKASQKRQREPRFAFMTKSEVDHLEDGYRWRKYGQKAVKNSPFPRSYYRCTYSSCNVKKRVERSYNDPTIVVTTYEGQHTHPSPATTRSSATGVDAQPYSGFSYGGGAACPPPVFSQHQQYFNCGYADPTTSGFGSGAGLCSQSCSGLLADHGLLQDMVPWSVIKKEEQLN